ncbi:MAG: PfkB family carbohydrate kinase [Filifactor alocis]|nr:PfkB family carbohydrate kinase [Filifactor alocis]
MAKLLGLGDNVLDRYIDKALMYPGGNAVNVSVMCRRYGIDTAYLGVIGSDEGGVHLLECLRKEKVELSRVQLKEGENSYSNIKLVENDRVFAGSDMTMSDSISLDEKDLDYIGSFDIVHTDIYSNLEGRLKDIKRTGVKLSFDFSDEFTEEYLDKVLPYVDYAFLSGSNYSSEEVMELLKKIMKKGVELAVVTKGKEGAFCIAGEDFYRREVEAIEPIDTLGAGDTFISRVLTGILKKEAPQVFLEEASKEATKACMWEGAFGYAKELK